MIILANGKEISITVKESDLTANNRYYFVMYKNSLYDPQDGFRPLEKGKFRLKDDARKEYDDVKRAADIEFTRRTKAVNRQTERNNLVDSMERALVEALTAQTAGEILESVMPEVKRRIIEEFGILPQKHEIITPNFTTEIKGVTHEKFDLVLNLINSNIPTFLTGAAGTGKNVICKQIAEALNLEFYFTNAVTQEYKLTGFIDAHGNFHETEFYKAFKNGGLFFLDEMDASIPETLITLNAAIANRYFDFPNGKIEAHKDFRVIAAGNTFGTGADIEYTGRYQLDAASLDRFALVEIDYSEKIENALADGDSDLVAFVDEFRKATKSAGIRHLVTYRTVERIAKLKDVLPLHEALKIAFLKHLEKDDLNIILNTFTRAQNTRYYRAAQEVAKCL